MKLDFLVKTHYIFLCLVLFNLSLISATPVFTLLAIRTSCNIIFVTLPSLVHSNVIILKKNNKFKYKSNRNKLKSINTGVRKMKLDDISQRYLCCC